MKKNYILVFIIVIITSITLNNQKNAYCEQVNIRLNNIIEIELDAKEYISKGLSDINKFAIGKNNYIYAIDNKNSENMIFIIDEKGNIVNTFVKKGQGPGECQLIGEIIIDNSNNVILDDVDSSKLVYYDNIGTYLKEERYPNKLDRIIPLDDGRYIACESQRTQESTNIWINIYDEKYMKIKTLDMITAPNKNYSKQIEAAYNPLTIGKGKQFIYIGYPGRDEIIKQYDYEGNLRREIPVGERKSKMTDEYKNKFKRNIYEIYDMIKDKLYFPEYLSPYHSFAIGQNNELAVMTYEWNEKENGYKYFVVSDDGTKKGIMYLNTYYNDGDILIKYGNNNKIYYLKENPSGYKTLIIQQIR